MAKKEKTNIIDYFTVRSFESEWIEFWTSDEEGETTYIRFKKNQIGDIIHFLGLLGDDV